MPELRCPIHGFIEFDEWERDIIAQAPFQRLRRIRQLGWTDYIYPGAMHTRFEHSLGVMHLATRLYDAVVDHSGDLIRSEFGFEDDGLKRTRRLVRIAALLHDVGHGPFSHVAEDLMPKGPDGSRLKHEAYSAEIVRTKLKSVIEDHPKNRTNSNITADEVASLIDGKRTVEGQAFFRELVSSQMDADRMDYLLRDSHHIGVRYGRFDLDRLVNTIVAVSGKEDTAPRIGVQEGGWHAAEALVSARYWMFTQVYFHPIRVAYDNHVAETLRTLLPGGEFPEPKATGLDQYLAMDDWWALGQIRANKGGPHGEILSTRAHYWKAYSTPEVPGQEDIDLLGKVQKALGGLLKYVGRASGSWYKLDVNKQIPVLPDHGTSTNTLSDFSTIVRGIRPSDQRILFVDRNDKQEAKQIVSEEVN